MLTWTTIYFLSEWVIRLAMLVYVPQRRSPAAARSWLIFLFVLPWPGLVVYSILGRHQLSRRRAQVDEKIGEYIDSHGEELLAPYVAHPELPERYEQAIELARNLGRLPVVRGNHVALLADYDSSIEALVADIDQAKHHVHLLYYIFADDRIGSRVMESLHRAAGRNVRCRVLLDALGSKKWLASVVDRLTRVGVEAVPVLPVGLIRRDRTRIDLRNHRKIAVIDGRIAYVGSQNIVDADFKPGIVYKELVARLTGPVVLELQLVFLSDYLKETKSRPDPDGLFPNVESRGPSLAQVLPSGPGFFGESIQRCLVTLFFAARHRIVVSTPYFVPDEAILQAMQTAVQRGVDVHLIVSHKPDQVLVGLAQRSYYEELLEAGVHIHEYLPGLLHAKDTLIDDSIAIIGSSNLDLRSFQLNAEVLMVVYDKAVAVALDREQRRHIADSRELSLDVWSRRPFRQQFLQNLARLVDSVL